MESSFDPGIDGIQIQGPQQLTTNNTECMTLSSATISVTRSDYSSIHGHPAADYDDANVNKPHFTPLLRPGSMGIF